MAIVTKPFSVTRPGLKSRVSVLTLIFRINASKNSIVAFHRLGTTQETTPNPKVET